MKLSKTFLRTLRQSPNDAVIASHALMMRADVVRKLSNGLYSYMSLGLKAKRNIERVIREELDAAGFSEIACSVTVPSELWEASGRFDKMAGEMLTAKSRSGGTLVVSPTCEEAFTALVGMGLSSYKELPITAYQINTKFRDEIRPRYGVMRAREFTMMDAYSFNQNAESLDETYNTFSAVYRRIFKRLGLNTISVKADTGSMGGRESEEFMVESPVGDDTLILCPKCRYAANAEKATCKQDDEEGSATSDAIERVDCPGVESIAQMEEFFKMSSRRFIKTLLYRVEGASLEKDFVQNFVAVAIRGDLDINETKLCNALKAVSVELADLESVQKYTLASHGFVGPVALPKTDGKTLALVVDQSVIFENKAMIHDCVTGSNTSAVDIKHVEPVRDFLPTISCDIRLTKAGDKCATCGETLYEKKGNELGHIFKLGDKYTKALGTTFLDTNGKPATPIMGCYGIGVDRTLASIIEEHNDERGIKWPISVAPFKVIIVPIAYKGEMQKACDELEATLTACSIDTLLDDRSERPGVKFCDADLIGIPIRVVVSERNLPNVETKEREGDNTQIVPLSEATDTIKKIIERLIAEGK